MVMLWRKQDNDRNIYVELWPTERRKFQVPVAIILKNNEYAAEYRVMGNHEFERNNFEKALEFYNTSLCLAEDRSADLALAYTNRANCFFRLKRYLNCLNDITLALKANTPPSLIVKLELRRRECNELMANNANNNVEREVDAQLSFPPTKYIPNMADCFRVENDVNYGTRVIATKDLEIGQNILIEEPCLQHTCDVPVRRCFNCYKEYMNLIPCRRCTKGMFCSEACMESSCVATQSRVCLDESLTETFRSVSLALQAYPNVDELMKATEDIRARSRLWDEVQDYMLSPSPRTTYRLFFSRGVKNTYLLDEWTAQNIQDQILHYNHLIRNPRIAQLFSTFRLQRFLQHLILHHVLVIKGCKGVFGLYEDERLTPDTPIDEHLSHLYAVAHYPISNMFNHSCVPNVFIISSNRKHVLKIIHRVKSGQELFVPYFTIGKRSEPLNARHEQLHELGWRLPHQQCICLLCQKDSKRDYELPDMSVVRRLADIIERPVKDVTRDDAINFINNATAFLNNNHDNHPSFNTIAAQNGLFIFWHMFPELI